jgi:hypothetical protein
MTDAPRAPRGIRATCDQGHTQDIYTPDMEIEEARAFAGLLDGTSPLYQCPPRSHPIPGGTVGRCEICGGWITCVLRGYADVSI